MKKKKKRKPTAKTKEKLFRFTTHPRFCNALICVYLPFRSGKTRTK